MLISAFFISLAELYRKFSDDLEVEKKFTGKNTQYRIHGNGYQHSRYTSDTCSCQNYNKQFQRMGFYALGIDQGMKDKQVNYIGYQEHQKDQRQERSDG